MVYRHKLLTTMFLCRVTHAIEVGLRLLASKYTYMLSIGVVTFQKLFAEGQTHVDITLMQNTGPRTFVT